MTTPESTQDKPTDVLSFSQRETQVGAPVIPKSKGSEDTLGDVVISIETAERQALEHDIALEEELAMLAVENQPIGVRMGRQQSTAHCARGETVVGRCRAARTCSRHGVSIATDLL